MASRSFGLLFAGLLSVSAFGILKADVGSEEAASSVIGVRLCGGSQYVAIDHFEPFFGGHLLRGGSIFHLVRPQTVHYVIHQTFSPQEEGPEIESDASGEGTVSSNEGLSTFSLMPEDGPFSRLSRMERLLNAWAANRLPFIHPMNEGFGGFGAENNEEGRQLPASSSEGLPFVSRPFGPFIDADLNLAHAARVMGLMKAVRDAISIRDEERANSAGGEQSITSFENGFQLVEDADREGIPKPEWPAPRVVGDMEDTAARPYEGRFVAASSRMTSAPARGCAMHLLLGDLHSKVESVLGDVNDRLNKLMGHVSGAVEWAHGKAVEGHGKIRDAMKKVPSPFIVAMASLAVFVALIVPLMVFLTCSLDQPSSSPSIMVLAPEVAPLLSAADYEGEVDEADALTTAYEAPAGKEEQ